MASVQVSNVNRRFLRLTRHGADRRQHAAPRTALIGQPVVQQIARNAKMLHQALGDNLAKYEWRFGVIGGPGLANFDPHTGKLGGLQWTVGSEDENSDEG